jgi:hypothetical protein
MAMLHNQMEKHQKNTIPSKTNHAMSVSPGMFHHFYVGNGLTLIGGKSMTLFYVNPMIISKIIRSLSC